MYMLAFLPLALHGGQLHTPADALQAKGPRRSVDRMQVGPLWGRRSSLFLQMTETPPGSQSWKSLMALEVAKL